MGAWIPERDLDGQWKIKTEAFAAKTTLVSGVEKKLYKRIHGKKYTQVPTGQTTNLDFSIPYPSAKVEAIEIINGEQGDCLTFEVLDTPTGTISTIPNYLLNTFGFDVYMPSGYYEQRSQYDADVIQDMQFRIKYTNNGSTRDIYINYVLNEVK